MKQCPNGQDEDPARCHRKYVYHKISPPHGSFPCVTSDTRYDIKILSVKCDGLVECLGGEDEEFCNIVELFLYISLGSVAVSFSIYLLVVWFYIRNHTTEDHSGMPFLSLRKIQCFVDNILYGQAPQGDSLETGQSSANVTEYNPELINLVLLFVQKMTYATKKITAKNFIKNIGENGSFLWMKVNLKEKISLFLFKHSEDGLLDKFLPEFLKEKLSGKAGRLGQILGLINSGKKCGASNADFIGDCLLIALLAKLHTGEYGRDVHTIALFSLIMFTFLPALINYFNTVMTEKLSGRWGGWE